jgi:hypothetical protein
MPTPTRPPKPSPTRDSIPLQPATQSLSNPPPNPSPTRYPIPLQPATQSLSNPPPKPSPTRHPIPLQPATQSSPTRHSIPSNPPLNPSPTRHSIPLQPATQSLSNPPLNPSPTRHSIRILSRDSHGAGAPEKNLPMPFAARERNTLKAHRTAAQNGLSSLFISRISLHHGKILLPPDGADRPRPRQPITPFPKIFQPVNTTLPSKITPNPAHPSPILKLGRPPTIMSAPAPSVLTDPPTPAAAPQTEPAWLSYRSSAKCFGPC